MMLIILAKAQLHKQLEGLASKQDKSQEEVYQDVRVLYEYLTECGIAKAAELGYPNVDEGDNNSGQAAMLMQAFAHAAVAQ